MKGSSIVKFLIAGSVVLGTVGESLSQERIDVFAEVRSVSAIDRPLVAEPIRDKALADAMNYFSLLKVDVSDTRLRATRDLLDRDAMMLDTRVKHAQEFASKVQSAIDILRVDRVLSEPEKRQLSEFLSKYKDVYTDLAFAASVGAQEELLNVRDNIVKYEAELAPFEIKDAIEQIQSWLEAAADQGDEEADQAAPELIGGEESIRRLLGLEKQRERHRHVKHGIRIVKTRTLELLKGKLEGLLKLALYDGGDLDKATARLAMQALEDARTVAAKHLQQVSAMKGKLAELRQEHSAAEIVVSIAIFNDLEHASSVSYSGSIVIQDGHGREHLISLVAAFEAGTAKEGSDIDGALLPSRQVTVLKFETRGMNAEVRSWMLGRKKGVNVQPRLRTLGGGQQITGAAVPVELVR